MFAVIVDSNAVTIDPDSAVLVKIVGHQASISDPTKHFSIAVKYVELPRHRADTTRSRGIGDDLSISPTVARNRWELQRLSGLDYLASFEFYANSGTEFVGEIQLFLVQSELKSPHCPLQYLCEIRQIIDPVFPAWYLKHRLEFPGPLEW